MASIVKARGLSRRYGRFWALRDLDWELNRGEAVALLGANGAGKTTLLSMLCTLARPSDGELQLMGMDPRKEPTRVRAQIGYVAHHTLLDDALTARENLRYYAGLSLPGRFGAKHSPAQGATTSPTTIIEENAEPETAQAA